MRAVAVSRAAKRLKLRTSLRTEAMISPPRRGLEVSAVGASAGTRRQPAAAAMVTVTARVRVRVNGRRREGLVKSWPRGQEVGRLLFCASPTVARHFARKIM